MFPPRLVLRWTLGDSLRILKVSNKVAPNIPKSYLSRNSFWQISCRLKHHQTNERERSRCSTTLLLETIPLGLPSLITKDPRVLKLCVYGNHCCCAKQRGRGPGLVLKIWSSELGRIPSAKGFVWGHRFWYSHISKKHQKPKASMFWWIFLWG